jgi:hypothetical protein
MKFLLTAAMAVIAIVLIPGNVLAQSNDVILRRLDVLEKENTALRDRVLARSEKDGRFACSTGGSAPVNCNLRNGHQGASCAGARPPPSIASRLERDSRRRLLGLFARPMVWNRARLSASTGEWSARRHSDWLRLSTACELACRCGGRYRSGGRQADRQL